MNDDTLYRCLAPLEEADTLLQDSGDGYHRSRLSHTMEAIKIDYDLPATATKDRADSAAL